MTSAPGAHSATQIPHPVQRSGSIASTRRAPSGRTVPLSDRKSPEVAATCTPPISATSRVSAERASARRSGASAAAAKTAPPGTRQPLSELAAAPRRRLEGNPLRQLAHESAEHLGGATGAADGGDPGLEQGDDRLRLDFDRAMRTERPTGGAAGAHAPAGRPAGRRRSSGSDGRRTGGQSAQRESQIRQQLIAGSFADRQADLIPEARAVRQQSCRRRPAIPGAGASPSVAARRSAARNGRTATSGSANPASRSAICASSSSATRTRMERRPGRAQRALLELAPGAACDQTDERTEEEIARAQPRVAGRNGNRDRAPALRKCRARRDRRTARAPRSASRAPTDRRQGPRAPVANAGGRPGRCPGAGRRHAPARRPPTGARSGR